MSEEIEERKQLLIDNIKEESKLSSDSDFSNNEVSEEGSDDPMTNKVKEKLGDSFLENLKTDLSLSSSFENPGEENIYRTIDYNKEKEQDVEVITSQQGFDQGNTKDFLSGMFNELVIGNVEGLSNLIPTVNNLYEEKDWANNWMDAVNKWGKSQRVIFSDDFYKPMDSIGDVNQSQFWGALGSGVGFVLGIANWAKAPKYFTKSGKALVKAEKIIKSEKITDFSMRSVLKIGKLLKGAGVVKSAKPTSQIVKTFNKAWKTNKGATAVELAAATKRINDINKASASTLKWSARAGSLFGGTTMMYNQIQQDAIESGLSREHSARFAMSVATLVSLTEGMALEWLGKIPAKSFRNLLLKNTVKQTLKTAGSKNLTASQTVGLFTKNFQKASVIGAGVAEGGAVEFGQEFVQTYIEEGARQLYDEVVAGNAKAGDGKFGKEVFDSSANNVYDFFDKGKDAGTTFTQSLFAGMIGAIIGSGMGVNSVIRNGSATNERNLQKETLYSYLSQSIVSKDTKALADLDALIDENVDKKKITIEEGRKAKETIQTMSTQIVGYVSAGITDNIASWQLSTLDNINDSIEKRKQEANVPESANAVIKKDSNTKKALVDQVQKNIISYFSEIISENSASEVGAKDFQDKMLEYDLLVDGIMNKNITDSNELKNDLESIFKKESEVESQENKNKIIKSKDNSSQVSYEEDGYTYTPENISLAEATLGIDASTDVKAQMEEIANKFNVSLGAVTEALDKTTTKGVSNAKEQFKNNKSTTTTTDTTTEAITEDEVTAMAVPRTFFADRIARIKEVISGKRKAGYSGTVGNEIASPMQDEFNEKDSNDRFISRGGSDVYLTQEEKSKIAKIKAEYKIKKINSVQREEAIQEVLRDAFKRALATYEVVEDAPTLGVKERVEAFKAKTAKTTDTKAKPKVDNTADTNTDTKAKPKRSITTINDISKNNFSEENDVDNPFIVAENADGNYEVSLNENGNPTFVLNSPQSFFQTGVQQSNESRGMKGAVMTSPAIVDKNGKVIQNAKITFTEKEGFENDFSNTTKTTQKPKVDSTTNTTTTTDNKTTSTTDNSSDTSKEEEARKDRLAKRNKKLFPKNLKGKNSLSAFVSEIYDITTNENGLPTAVYKNRKGEIDVVITGSKNGSLTDLVVFKRMYKNGGITSTNQFTSKFQIQSKEANFKQMLKDAQDKLPENHEWVENKSISISGLSVFNKALDFGYTTKKDSDGNVVTRDTPINIATKENVDTIGEEAFDSFKSQSLEEANKKAEESKKAFPGIEVEVQETKQGPLKFYKVISKLPVLVSSDAIDGNNNNNNNNLNQNQDGKKSNEKGNEKNNEKSNEKNEVLLDEINPESSTIEFTDENKNELDNLFDNISNEENVKEQLVSPRTDRQKASSNRNLNDKIKSRFKKLFPNIPVRKINQLFDKYGAERMANVTKEGIGISDNAFQDSIIHEYGHIYLDMIADSQIVKRGEEWIKGTEYFKEAQELYPDESEEYQANEALNQAIAEDSFSKLEKKLDGNLIEQFVELSKKIWRSIKRKFVGVNDNDLVSYLSDSMIYASKPFNVNTSYLGNNTKNQLTQVSEFTAELSNKLQNSMATLKIFIMDNPNMQGKISEETLKGQMYSQIADLLNKNGDISLEEGLSRSQKAAEVVKQLDKNGTTGILITNAIERLSKIPLMNEKDKADSISEAMDAIDGKSNKEDIKGTQRISTSIKGIMASLLTPDGEIINQDSVWSYLGSLASEISNKKDFDKRLEEDSDTNDVAFAIKSLLNHIKLYDSANKNKSKEKLSLLNSFYTEIMSITPVNYYSVVVENLKNKAGEITDGIKLKLNKLNKSRLSTKAFNDLLEKMKSNFDSFKITLSGDQNVNLKEWYKKNSVIQKGGRYLKYSVIEDLDEDQVIDQVLDYLGISGVNLNNLYTAMKDQAPKAFDTLLDNKFVDLAPRQVMAVKLVEYLANTDLDPKSSVGYITKIYQKSNADTGVQSMFINSSGNNINSIRYGFFLNRQFDMLRNNKEYADAFLKSPVFKGNSILKRIINKKEDAIEWYIHDAINNVITGKVSEHSNQNGIDLLLNQLINFGATIGNTYGQQAYINDRSHTTFAKVDFIDSKQVDFSMVSQKSKEEFILNQEYKKLQNVKNGAKLQKEFIKTFNEISYNQAEIIDGKIVVNVLTYEKQNNENSLIVKKRAELAKEVDRIKTAIIGASLEEALLKDRYKDKTLNNFIKDFIFNDHINRQMLTDLLQGPMAKRIIVNKGDGVFKIDKPNIIKRAAGIDSGGAKVELTKKVKFFVYKKNDLLNNPVSDSFSFNGAGLYQEVRSLMGKANPQGHNAKDMIYQVDENGDLLFVKMSTLNHVKEVDEKGNEIDSIKEMGDGYTDVAEILDALEAKYSDEFHIKIVDEKTLKGEFIHEEAMTLEEMYEEVQNGNLEKISSKSSFEKKIVNYQQPFNLHNDISQTDLEDQKVRLGSQISKIILNQLANRIDGENGDIQRFENLMVEISKKRMGLYGDEDYNDSVLYETLYGTDNLLQSLGNSTDQLNDPALFTLIQEVREINRQLGENLDDARKNILKLNRKGNYEDLSDSDQISYKASEGVLAGKRTINKLDHPDMITKIQQLISSKIKERALRVELSGKYVQMAPDLAHGTESALGANEVKVPWSMFGKTKEQALAFLDEMKDKGGLKTVLVRVPASGPVSTMNATVVGFVDGKSNTAILPHEFTLKSDADHDGDKVFIYRNDLKNSGEEGSLKTTIKNSKQNELFDMMYELNGTEEIIRQRDEGDLDIKALSDAADDLHAQLLKEGKEGLDVGYDFLTPSELANLNSRLSFGSNAVGIFAVAGKLASMLSQSNATLVEAFTVDIGNGNVLSFNDFKIDNLKDIAVLLQAALDITADPTLLKTGVNAVTVNVASTMAMLGVNPKEIMRFLNNKSIKKFVKNLNSNDNAFEIDNDQAVRQTLKQLIYEAKKDNSEDLEILEAYDRLSKISDSLNSLVNIVQMDGKIPNDSAKLNVVKEAFEKMYSGKSPILLNNFTRRPLIKHYEKVLNLVSDIYKHHFVIESEAYAKQVDKIKPKITYAGGTSKYSSEKNRRGVDQTFLHIAAQKLLSNEMLEQIEGTVGGAKVWVDNFVKSVKTFTLFKNSSKSTEQMYQDSETEYSYDFERYSNITYNKKKINLYDLYENSPTGWLDFLNSLGENESAKIEITNAVEDYIDYKSRVQPMIDVSGNNFIEMLKVKTNDDDGTSILSGSQDIRFMTQSDKKKAKEDFPKLSQDLQDQFKAFQILKYGLSNKLGSLVSIMPQEFGASLLEQMSQIGENAGKTSIESYNINLNYIMANPGLVQEMEIEPYNTRVIDGETYLVAKTEIELDGVKIKTDEPIHYNGDEKTGDNGDRFIKSKSTQEIYLLRGGETSNPGSLLKIQTTFSKSDNHVLYDTNAKLVSGENIKEQLIEAEAIRNGCS